MNKPVSQVAAGVRRRNSCHALTLFALTLVTVALVTGCKQSGSSGKPDNVEYYTCTMHPSVKSQDPKAKCPICSMDLIPVPKKGAPAHEYANMPGMPMEAAGTNAPEASGSDASTEFSVP